MGSAGERALVGVRFLLPSVLALFVGCDQSESGTAPSSNPVAGSAAALFTEVTEQLNLDFQHDAGIDGSFFFPETTSAGAALFDFDNDGDLDVYLINSGPHDADSPNVSKPPNRLYRQESDGTFSDVTARSGVGDTGYGMGCAVGDIDNDGDLDLFVTNYGRDVLYRNDGDGTFTEITSAAGISGEQWSTSACFFDFDRDGFLDLLVATYVSYDPAKSCMDLSGRPEYCGPNAFPGVADVLYRNQGDGTFVDVSDSSGISAYPGKGLGVACADFNGDGWPDIYVANDGEPNHLWINRGDGTFHELAMALGAAFNQQGQPEASMGVACADIDNDGDLDLLLTHLAGEMNTLYVNQHGNWFEDRTSAMGMAGDTIPFTGFGTSFLDYDHDGNLDLLIVNGRVKRGPPLPNVPLRTDRDIYAEPNLLYQGLGGYRFHAVSDLAGRLCSVAEVSRGLVIGDIDNDGDLDVLITNSAGPCRLFRNDVPKTGNWLIVRAFDPDRNRDAIGASIAVTTGGRTIYRQIDAGFSYLSSGDLRAHFGLGAVEQVERIVVRWPDGAVERFGTTAVDQSIVLVKGSGTAAP